MRSTTRIVGGRCRRLLLSWAGTSVASFSCRSSTITAIVVAILVLAVAPHGIGQTASAAAAPPYRESIDCCNNAGRMFVVYEQRRETACDPIYVGKASARGSSTSAAMANRGYPGGIKSGFDSYFIVWKKHSPVDYGPNYGQVARQAFCKEKEYAHKRQGEGFTLTNEAPFRCDSALANTPDPHPGVRPRGGDSDEPCPCVDDLVPIPPPSLAPDRSGNKKKKVGKVGVSFTWNLPSFGGGNGTLRHSLSGLPSGLSSAGTRISGRPSRVGTWTVTYSAVDSDGDRASVAILIVVTKDDDDDDSPPSSPCHRVECPHTGTLICASECERIGCDLDMVPC